MYFAWIPKGGSRIDFILPTFELTKNWNLGDGELTHNTEENPGFGGVEHLETLTDPTVITLEYLIRAGSRQELFDTQRALTAMFNPELGEGRLIWVQEDGREYSVNCIADALPNYPSGESRGMTWQVVRLALFCSDPSWYSGAITLTNLATTSASMFNFKFPFIVGSTSSMKVITNLGDKRSPLRIVLYGDITNPVIKNLETGETLSLNITLAAGEQFIITTGDGDKTLTKVSTTGVKTTGFPYLVTGSTFPQLIHGDNRITVTRTTAGATSRATVEASDKYIRMW